MQERVASTIKKEYGFCSTLFVKIHKSVKSISDEWLNTMCWNSCVFRISTIELCVEFSLIFFGIEK